MQQTEAYFYTTVTDAGYNQAQAARYTSPRASMAQAMQRRSCWPARPWPD